MHLVIEDIIQLYYYILYYNKNKTYEVSYIK